MNTMVTLLVDLAIIALVLLGVQQFRSPRAALRGNWIAAAALGLAVLTVALRHEIVSPGLVIGLLLAGAALGGLVAVRVSMIGTPALVALQHGAGAVAAFLVCFIELVRASGGGGGVEELSGLLGLVLGAATLSGSLVASAKLANLVSQPPQVLPGHSAWFGGSVVAVLAVSVSASQASGAALVAQLLLLVLLGGVAGLLFSVRIGGADMPVLISFLNATAGLAAAFAGVVIGNRLLVAAGATVAASGSVLTIAMCRAMNRSLFAVLGGLRPAAPTTPRAPAASAPPRGGASAGSPRAEEVAEPRNPFSAAVEALRTAGSVVVIPGYGMAMAQAQHEVVELARRLEDRGRSVRFAIHPVAGRMPGHMHVLLSEAEAPWEQLRELEINPEFPETDLAIVVGASDVVNPAAVTTEGTPISGMPILNAHEARQVLVVNLNESPGYSGVRNQLYDMRHAILLWGDAKRTLQSLLASPALDPEQEAVPGVT